MNEVTTNYNLTYSQLPDEFQNKIQQREAVDRWTDEYKFQKKKEEFNLSEHLLTWFSNMGSKNTRNMFDTFITDFLLYVRGDVLAVNASVADSYIRHLLTVKSNGKTVKNYVAGVSSFYTYLVRQEAVTFNPFLRSPVPIRIETSDKYVPSDKDIEAIRDSINKMENSIARNKMRLGLYILEKYGVRKDFLDNVRLVDGKMISYSKGKEYVVHCEGDIMLEGSKELLPSLNSNTFSNNLNKIVKRLVESDKVGGRFSPHCLRHRFAIREYKKSPDIDKLMKLLHHTSPIATSNYLRNLRVI